MVTLPAAVAAHASAQRAEEEGQQESAKEYKNTLRWTTASEVDNFGFDVYRSESEDGPFRRITKDPIPGAGTVDEPTRYRYEDTTIDPTLDYYYYVESISMSGDRKKFTPTIRAGAKIDGEAEEAEKEG